MRCPFTGCCLEYIGEEQRTDPENRDFGDAGA